MDDHSQNKWLLSTPELISLLQIAEVTHLVEFFQQARGIVRSAESLKTAEENLFKRGILTKNGKIDDEYITALSPLLHPDKILMCVRVQPGTGPESITFLRKGNAVLQYSFLPVQEINCFEVITAAGQINAFFADWYQLQKFASIEQTCSLPEDLFEQMRLLIQEDKTSAAADLLKQSGCTVQLAEQLVPALQKPSFSGSLAVMELEGDTALDAYSLAILAHQETIWHMYELDLDKRLLAIDGNTASLKQQLEGIVQRFLGDDMLDEPLDNQNVVTFTLDIDELAYCLHAINASTLAVGFLTKAYPDKSEQEVSNRLQRAGTRLLARGWCKPSATGLPVPVARLEAAVFPLARYDYAVQAEITRPNLHSTADIYVLKNRSFTAILHPNKDVYVLEHGPVMAQAAYLSKLFLDFGEGADAKTGESHKISYSLISGAIERELDPRDSLINSGFGREEAERFAADLKDTLYRGSILRVNAGSQEGPENVQKSVKPLLLLLRGRDRSWLFEFSSADDDTGQVAQVDRASFIRTLSTFLQ
jgi:hypothetical protein